MSEHIDIGPDHRLGLVLGGGGARGLAAVGIVDVLEERGLRPAMVAGTSMGALVGAFLCAGYGAAEIHALALGSKWTDVIDISASGGLMKGDRFAQWLADRLPHTFEELDMPLVCTATDIDSGELVILDKGDLIVALRATCAFPGAFSPVRIGERNLVDGGLKSTVPVLALRGTGMDRVIACDFQAPLGRPVVPAATDAFRTWARFWETLTFRRRNLAADILLKAVDILQAEVCRRQLLDDPPDLLLAPPMPGVNLEDFRLAPKIVELGAAAARAALGNPDQECEVAP